MSRELFCRPSMHYHYTIRMEGSQLLKWGIVGKQIPVPNVSANYKSVIKPLSFVS